MRACLTFLACKEVIGGGWMVVVSNQQGRVDFHQLANRWRIRAQFPRDRIGAVSF